MPAAKPHLRTVGHQHSQSPRITLLLRTLDPQMPRPCQVRLDSKPPRTPPTVQSHKAQGAPPGARGTSHFPAALGEGVGWGRGASESQMLFLGSPESLPADSALGAVWQGVAKPQVCPRPPGGASPLQWWGSPLPVSRWGLSSDGGSQGTAPARWEWLGGRRLTPLLLATESWETDELPVVRAPWGLCLAHAAGLW